MTTPFTPPISATGIGAQRRWILDIGENENFVLAQLLGELRALLTGVRDDPNQATSPLLRRLFPPTYLDDDDKQAEYFRLMHDELVTSRLHQVDAVYSLLGLDDPDDHSPRTLDEGGAVALMQSVNAVRIVLGSLLDIDEDDDGDVDDDHPMANEHHLYDYLSYLLEWTVRSFEAPPAG